MSDSFASHPSAITLEQLIALNDEIAALVRAGVPLELGLDRLGSDLPGRLGQLSTTLAERMRRGEALDAIVASEECRFPPVYRAVVETGLRTGSLAAALEAISGSARRLTQSRQMVIASLLYPLLVFLIAWTLFVLFVAWYAPSVAPQFEAMVPKASQPLVWLASLGRSAIVWGPAVPLVVIVLAGLWWWQASRAALVQPRAARLLLGWLPWMGPMLRSFRAGAFADMLALLVEHDVPLPEAIRLAAEATGDARTNAVAGSIAVSLERGEPLSAGVAELAEFPPLLRWLLTIGQQRNSLVPALRHAADVYQRRGLRQAEVARTFLPILCIAVIGGGSLLTCALMLFVPWVSLLYSLS